MLAVTVLKSPARSLKSSRSLTSLPLSLVLPLSPGALLGGSSYAVALDFASVD